MHTGLYSIDFYLPDKNLCIEVDGSMHYYGLTTHELLKTKLKYRLMAGANLNVLRLSHHDYSPLKSDAIVAAIESCKEKESERPHDVFYS